MRQEIFVEELKQIQLEILNEVHSFCQDKNITYFLSSGTLIGAVRHKGYIPWDDDIDLYMPRTDYERFLSSFNRSDNKYRVYSLKTDESCVIAYAKVENTNTVMIEKVDNPMKIGVNIDIFPIDGVPSDKAKRKRYFSKIQRLRNVITLKDVSLNFHRRNIFKNLILIAGKTMLFFISLRKMVQKLDRAIDKNMTDTEYVCNLIMGNGYGTEFHRRSIEKSVDIEFEGRIYKTMAGYDEYLRQTYGNYMQLPPKELRVSHHAFEAYWK